MNSQKQNRHSLMAKGIMVLLAILVLIFIITFAWFRNVPPPVDAQGVSMKTKSGSDFEYAIGFKTSQTFGEYLVTDFTNSDNSEWDIEDLNVPGKTQADGTTPISYNLLYDYQPIDLTGNGYTLIRPAMDYGNWKIKSGYDYSIAEANTQYISFDLILRSKAATTLSLGPNSYAIGASEVQGTTPKPDGSKLIGSSAERKSDYGIFSRDAIVGAVRVAFLGFDDTLTADSYLTGTQDDKLNHTPSLLWVPRPDLYLNNNGNDLSTSGWSLNTGVTSGKTFDLHSQAMNDTAYSTYRHQYYNVFEIDDPNDTPEVVTDNSEYVHVSSKDAEGNEYHLNDTVTLIPLDKPKTVHEGNEDATYYYGKVRVRIWVDGTDTESRRALAKGKFKFNFDLTTN